MTPEEYTQEVARTASDDNDSLVMTYMEAYPPGLAAVDLVSDLAVAADIGETIDGVKKAIFHGHHYDIDPSVVSFGFTESQRAELEVHVRRYLIRNFPVGGPMLMATLGAVGEAGELADHVGEAIVDDLPLDRNHIIKELGDILWYVARAALAFGVPLEEIMQRNVDKLRKRYPDGFSSERSINREGG